MRQMTRIPLELQTIPYVEPLSTNIGVDNVQNEEDLRALESLNLIAEKQLFDRFMDQSGGELLLYKKQINDEQNAQNEKLFLQEVFPREYTNAENEIVGNGCHCQSPELAEDECSCKMCGGGIFGDVLNWLKSKSSGIKKKVANDIVGAISKGFKHTQSTGY